MRREWQSEEKQSNRRMKRQSLILDQEKVDRAREILRAASDAEAISRALDTVNELAEFY